MIADFVAFLGNTSAISAVVAARIYPDQLPQNATLPALTYTVIDRVGVDDLSGSAGKARRRVQVDSWASTRKASVALSEAVRRALNGFYGQWADTTVGSVRMANEIYLFEDEAGVVGIYRVMQDYIIGHLED